MPGRVRGTTPDRPGETSSDGAHTGDGGPVPHASGYDYSDVSLPSLFTDGLLDFSQLSDHLPVSAVGDGAARAKAYVQSYLMVDWLFRQPDALTRFSRMVASYSAGRTDADVLSETLQLTPRALLDQIATHIHSLAG